VIFGPSGVGKGSVIARLLDSNPEGFLLSVSVTTRPPRPGESEGREYRFVSDEEFDGLVADDALLEWAQVFGRRYGTPAAPVDEAREAGRDVLLEIDIQGAAKVRRRAPDAVLVFLAPPSPERYREVLRNRLRARGTESEEEVERRVAEAERELGGAEAMLERGEVAERVVNDDLDRATARVAVILERLRSGDGSDDSPEAPTTEGSRPG